MQNQNRRAILYSALVMIVLLLLLLTLITDNNRKYAEAINAAVTSIVRTNNALTTQIARTEAATQRAMLTGLPMTQTRAAAAPAATSTP